MPNFTQKFFMQALYSDRSVCMTAICYSQSILVVPTNAQLLKEKKTCAKLRIDISKTEGPVRIYTDRRT